MKELGLFLIVLACFLIIPSIVNADDIRNVTESMSYGDLNKTLDLYYRKLTEDTSYGDLKFTGVETVVPSLSVHVFYGSDIGVGDITVYLTNGTNAFQRMTNENGDAFFNGTVLGLMDGNFSVEIEEVPNNFILPEGRAVQVIRNRANSISIRLEERSEVEDVTRVRVEVYYYTITGKTPKKDQVVSLIAGKDEFFGSTDSSGVVVFDLRPVAPIGEFTLDVNVTDEFYPVNPLDGEWQIGKTTDVKVELKLVEVPWFLPAELFYSIRSGSVKGTLDWFYKNWMIIIVGVIFLMAVPLLYKVVKEEMKMGKVRKRKK